MKNEEILKMPVGKFAKLKPSGKPYWFLRILCNKQGNDRFYNEDNVLVEDIISFTSGHISKTLKQNLERNINSRTVLKSLRILRDKLLGAGLSKENNPFLQGIYFLTVSSPISEWEDFWMSTYDLNSTEVKKFSELLMKVDYKVPQFWYLV